MFMYIGFISNQALYSMIMPAPDAAVLPKMSFFVSDADVLPQMLFCLWCCFLLNVVLYLHQMLVFHYNKSSVSHQMQAFWHKRPLPKMQVFASGAGVF